VLGFYSAIRLVFILLHTFRKEHAEHYSTPHVDVLQALYDACDAGYIYFNPDNLDDNNNMYVQRPALFLEQMTGRKWEYRKEREQCISVSPESMQCSGMSDRKQDTRSGISSGKHSNR